MTSSSSSSSDSFNPNTLLWSTNHVNGSIRRKDDMLQIYSCGRFRTICKECTRKALPQQSLCSLHSKNVTNLSGTSLVGCQCLDILEEELGIKITHAHVGKHGLLHGSEKVIMGHKVDGFNEEKDIIFEFLGDYWHGNPILYSKNDMNTKSKKTFGILYEETFYRLEKLKMAGFTVRYIWETDYKKYLIELRDFPDTRLDSFFITL